MMEQKEILLRLSKTTAVAKQMLAKLTPRQREILKGVLAPRKPNSYYDQ